MQCVQFETRLNELLDERLSPELEPAIGRHAGECARCAALLAAHEDLLTGVESLRMSEAMPDLAVRVAGELSRRHILAPPARGWWIPAAAAALLLGVGVWCWAAASRKGAEQLATSGTDMSVAMRTAAHEGPSPSASPASTAPTATSRSRVVSQWIVTDTKALAEDFSVRPRLLMEQMADGIKPVADSMSAALEALRRNLPTTEAGSHSS
jgi:hypothetical protein